MHSIWANAENRKAQAKVQSNSCRASYTYKEGRCGRDARQGSQSGEGGTNMSFGFFNQDGFEVVIWILVIIFLLSIFFDEGID
jgi:hypothetical protein